MDLAMHLITQMSHAGIIFDADSEFKVQLPPLCLFYSPRNLWQKFSLKKTDLSQFISHVICIRGHP